MGFLLRLLGAWLGFSFSFLAAWAGVVTYFERKAKKAAPHHDSVSLEWWEEEAWKKLVGNVSR